MLIQITIAPNMAEASEKSTLEKIASSPEWLNLLYYDAKGSTYKSMVTSSEFFVDRERGGTDPLAELKATVAVFREDSPASDSHPQCLFPARYRLLQKYASLKPEVVCPQYQQWLEQYAPESLVLAYASQYISNPASVFGHAFLLAPSTRQTKAFWLTYNYAAAMPANTNGAAYVYGGLTGWFPGDFSVLPFYNRIYQYGSIENRDLWLYEIRLTTEELDFFLRHLWELVHAAKFTYYFMDENCAGALMRTFAAVFPEMRDSSHLSFYVAPIEVVGALKRAGRISNVDLIPSESNTLHESLRTLNAKQTDRFREATANPQQKIDSVDQSLAEALIYYTSYMTHKNGGVLPEELRPLERAAFVARSKFDAPPNEFRKSEALTLAPHLAHSTSALQIGASSLNKKAVLDFGYRFTIHDLLDPDPGFLLNSSIEILNFKLSATSETIWFEDLTFIKVENFQPYRSFSPEAAWRAKVSIIENIVTPDVYDQFPQIQLGYGANFEAGSQFFYLLATSELNFGHDLPQGRVTVGPELGTILRYGPLKATFAFGTGKSVSEGGGESYLNFSQGLSWKIEENFNLIQTMNLIHLFDQDLYGSRLKLGVRYYF